MHGTPDIVMYIEKPQRISFTLVISQYYVFITSVLQYPISVASGIKMTVELRFGVS